MRQFDVHWLKPPHQGAVAILQSDVSDRLATRVVAPLSAQSLGQSLQHLRIDVDFGAGLYELQIDRLAAIEIRAIGQLAGSLSHEQDRIKRGLDLLFLGF